MTLRITNLIISIIEALASAWAMGLCHFSPGEYWLRFWVALIAIIVLSDIFSGQRVIVE